MDLRQLKYFVAIGEEEHFGRAARKLRVAQPALSRQIKLLEAELGFDLFVRLPRGVCLTVPGRIFLSEVKGIDHSLSQAVRNATLANAGQTGTLSLSLIESVAWHGLIPDAFRAFRTDYPQVELSLTAMPTAGQLEALHQRRTDAALIYNAPPHDDLIATPLIAHRAVVAIPEDCPLLDVQELRLQDLAGHPMIGFRREASPRFYDDIQNAMTRAGIKPRTLVELMTETEILALVSAGAGLAVANSMQRWRAPVHVRFREVRDLDVTLQLMLVQRKGEQSPTLSAFTSILSKMLRDDAGGETD